MTKVADRFVRLMQWLEGPGFGLFAVACGLGVVACAILVIEHLGA